MYAILMYDISTLEPAGSRTLGKMVKLCRTFLHHTQKSVFEGEISEAKLMRLKDEIKALINEEKDYIILFTVANKNNIFRENIGLNYLPTEEII